MPDKPFFRDSIGLVFCQRGAPKQKNLGSWFLTFLRTTKSAFTPTQFVAYTHEQLAQASFLPGWKDQDASHIVVVPTHFLLAEEAYDLPLTALRIREHKKVVSKSGDIVKYGLCVEEELSE